MDLHEAAKFKVCRWCCAKFVDIKLTSHWIFKDEVEEFTQLGKQCMKVFEPLTADENYLRQNVLYITCKLNIANVVLVMPQKNIPYNLIGLIFASNAFSMYS